MGGLAERASAGGLFRFARSLTGPLVGLVALCVFLSFSTDTFLSLRNILNVMDQITVLGVMAVGMTLVILIAGIDLSVGSVLALSGHGAGLPRLHPAMALRHKHHRRAGGIRAVRPGIRPDGDAPAYAGVHRHADDDVAASFVTGVDLLVDGGFECW